MDNETILKIPQSVGVNADKEPGLLKMIVEDIRCALHRDPAARNWVEVLFNYAGLHAIWAYRINHWLWVHKVYFPGALVLTDRPLVHRG